MKRWISIILVFTLMLSLCACGEREIEQDSSELTMYVGLGNNDFGYYDALHALVQEKLGVDLHYVYSRTLDTTTAMFLRMKNNDVPVDIVVTAMAADAETQRACLIDLAAYTSLPDLFSSKRIADLAHDGEVYQLPFTTRLIGFEYNRTLLQEMGWVLPSNFKEMVELKEKCEEAGYLFALSGGVATGHGFNYLFHLMGSDYLSTADGAEWYNSFMKGERDISEFAEEAEYFRRYVEAGLFGQFHDEDWQAGTACRKQRALFYYNILNDVDCYDGFRYNENGTLYGAHYLNGEVVAHKDANGNAVLTDAGYELYDASNSAHEGLTRYTIPGTEEVHDEYGSMPWISENGSGNSFTIYDNMLVGLNRHLLEPDQADKLETAKKVLAFMTSEEVTSLFSNLYRDGFVATNSYTIDKTRLYSAFAKDVSRGYLTHWYYNDFNSSTIVAVGELVNDYIRGGQGVSMEQIMEELQQRRDNNLRGSVDTLFTVNKTLGYETVARLEAVAGAMSLQRKLDSMGMDAEVNAALVPYVGDITELSVGIGTPVAQQKIYAGEFDISAVRSVIGVGNDTPQLFTLKGSELSTLRDEGYKDFAFACALKGSESIDSAKTYLVAIAPACLEESLYQSYLKQGKVVCTADGTVLTGSVEEGMSLYAELCPTLDDTISWE